MWGGDGQDFESVNLKGKNTESKPKLVNIGVK